MVFGRHVTEPLALLDVLEGKGDRLPLLRRERGEEHLRGVGHVRRRLIGCVNRAEIRHETAGAEEQTSRGS